MDVGPFCLFLPLPSFLLRELRAREGNYLLFGSTSTCWSLSAVDAVGRQRLPAYLQM